MARIRGPLLLIHGDRDLMIPDDHSMRLRALAQSARVVVIHGAAHNDLQDFDEYLQVLAQELQRL